MAKKGRAAQALATAAIGSFIAGTIGTLLVAFFTPVARRHAVEDRRAVVLRDHAAVARAGHQRARLVQAARLHRPVHRPDHRPGRARPVHRPGAAHRRHPAARRRHRHRRRRGRHLRHRRGALDRRPPAPPAGRRHPGRPAVHGPRRLGAAPGGRGCAAPRSASPSAPCPRVAPRRRRSCPTYRAAARQAQGDEFGHGAIEGVAGPEAANNASAAGMFVPLLALGLPVTATAADPARRHADLRHRARADPDDRPARPGLDPAGQPAHRQHPAAGDQPAARAAVGQAAADPATAALRGHPVLRLARRLHRQPERVRPRPAAGLRPRGLRRSGASGSRSCR